MKKLKLYKFIPLWIFGFFVLFSSCSLINKEPNFLVILTDDQGWGDLELTGNNSLKTPTLNKLAESGTLFTSFYVSPVCSPTRAEILTGNYHPKSGVYGVSEGGERINLNQKLISEYFFENGYKTALFGKWHNGQQHPYHPNSRGFETFIGYCSGHIGEYFDAELEKNGIFFKSKGYLTDYITDQTISYIDNIENNPFFIFLSINTPHSPMQVPDEWWEKFRQINPDKLNLPDHSSQNKDLNKNFGDAKNNTLINHTKAAYAMIENIDWNISRILNSLIDNNKLENTVILFLGDNGPNGNRWNDSLKGRKGSTDEGGVKSPLIFNYPQINKNLKKRIDKLSSSIDILPTLLDIADISYDKTIDGESLKSSLNNRISDNKRVIFNHWNGKVSVRSNNYRLDSENNLYDIKNDPGQTIIINENKIRDELIYKKENWINNVLSLTDKSIKRPFTIVGDKNKLNVLPARDAMYSGKIQRSNRYPNDSFLTNLKENDSIYWPIEVYEDGFYKMDIYHTSSKKSLGSQILISSNASKTKVTVDEIFESQLRGMENDRVERIESYLKNFTILKTDSIYLTKKSDFLSLKRIKPVDGIIDFKRIILYR